jgi:hypothetical protein
MDGADASTTIIDASNSAHTLTALGDAELDTAESVFGGASLKLAGAGVVYAPDSTDWHFGTDPVTIHFRMKQTDTTNNQVVLSQVTESGNQRSWQFIRLITSGFMQFKTSANGSTWASVTLTGTTNVTDGAWHQIAAVRNGNDWDLYVDGVSEASTTNSDAVFNSTAVMAIGAQNVSPPSTGANNYIGWLDEVEIRTEAMWITDFPVPTAPSGLVQQIEFTAFGEALVESEVLASTPCRVAPSSEPTSFLTFTSASGSSVGSPLNITVADAVGVFSYTSATQLLTYAAPGDTAGTAVTVSSDGTYVLYSNDVNKWVEITIVAASLPGSDQTDNITITSGFTGNNVFDSISSSEATAGDMEYRCVFIKNESSDNLASFGIYLDHTSPASTDNMFISVDRPTNDTGGSVELIADESTAPAGLNFSSPDCGNPTVIEQTDLAPGEIVAVWMRWDISAGATITENNVASLGVTYTATLTN